MLLTPEQILIISLVAAVITQGAKIVFAWFQKPVDRKWITVILLVIGLVMAYIWARPALPVWPVMTGDPMADAVAVTGFFVALVASAAAVVAVAQPIYNLLLQKVFEKIGIGDTLVTQLVDGAISKPSDGGQA